MKEQRVIIEIDTEGRITADADGFTGDACIKDLERLLEGVASTWEQVARKNDPGDTRVSTRRTETITTGGKKP